MRNKALTVPFVLWAMIFIVVPLIMIVWYGVTVEESGVSRLLSVRLDELDDDAAGIEKSERSEK